MSTNECREFLRKVKNPDQDIRSMAISDLLSHLANMTGSLTRDDSDQYTQALVVLLLDAQSYVQNLATECLGQIFKLIDSNTTFNTVGNICTRISQRDIADGASALSVALRVLVSRVAESTEDKSFVTQLAYPIVSALSESKNMPPDVNIDMFTALADIVENVGSLLAADDEPADSIQALLLDYSAHPNPTIVRRAFAVLGKFVVHVSGDRSKSALDTIFQRYKDSTKDSDKSMLLGVLVAIARQRSARIKHLALPIIDCELETVDDCDSELRVTSLLAFETLARHCPELASARTNEIYAAAIKAAKYDPNYNHGDDSDGGDADDVMGSASDDDLEEEFGDEFDEDIYDDNEDISWNVRVGGVRLLGTLVKSNLLCSEDAATKIGSVLIGRFKERLDIVRIEVLATYTAMLEEIKVRLGPPPATVLAQTQSMDVESAAANAVVRQAPQAVSALLSAARQYPRSTETKQLMFTIFNRLCTIRRSVLDDALASILGAVVSALAANDFAGALQSAATNIVQTNLKLDVLEFLREFLARDDMSDAADTFLFTVKDGIKSSVSSNTLKVPATALCVAGDMLVLLRVAADSSALDVSRYVPWIEDMVNLAVSVAGTSDQLLRASAYNFIGTTLCQFGDVVDGALVDQTLAMLTTWKNGTANVLALIHALNIAVSPSTHLSRQSIVAVVPSALEQIDPLLRQSDIKVCTSALGVIRCLSSYYDLANPTVSERIMHGIVAIIEKSPLSPPVVALHALADICAHVPEESAKRVAHSLVKLLSVASVHDNQSNVALERVYEVVGKRFPTTAEQWKVEILGNWQQAYEEFVKQRSAKSNDAIQAQFPSSMLATAARSLLALFVGRHKTADQAWTSEFLSELLHAVPKSTVEVAHTCLALRVLGYAARGGLLAQEPELTKQLYAYAASENDDVRNEAAFALGSHVGNNPDMLAALFNNATASSGASGTSKMQAVKAALDLAIGIKRDACAAESLWAQVTSFVQESQKPVSDVVAQGLAVFATTFPDVYVPRLASCIASSENAVAKVLFITAFRTVIADKHLSAQCDEQIKLVLSTALASITDADVNVRRLTMLALFSLIQTKKELLEDLIPTIQPALFQQTEVDASLVRKIKMGPFTKTVDDGLEARKCAYQCVHMLIRHAPLVVDGAAVVDSVVRGISDEQEIRIIVQHIVTESIATLANCYAEKLEDIVGAVETARSVKIPAKAVKQEIDKHNELLKSTIAIFVNLMPIIKPSRLQSGVFARVQEDMNNPANDEMYLYYKSCIESSGAPK
ncbi:hypothetical protein EV174_001260 [Coemansia sp. RSA 2320]|nr:hypothetical protein EV174_001260 [Coemansia sp. RSA 2320]